MNKPVSNPQFWRHRINEALAMGWELHKAVYNIDLSVWGKIQSQTRAALLPHLQRGTKLLDVGCGYGALLDCLHDQEEIYYAGIDISDDLLEIANLKYPGMRFYNLDARLPLPFHPQEFDIAVFRSVRDMVVDNSDGNDWQQMKKYVGHCAKSVAVIEYEELPIKFHLYNVETWN